MKLTHEQVIRALERLDKGWPDDLLIHAGSGGLLLMKINPDHTACCYRQQDRLWGGIHIINDGGDPDWDSYGVTG